MKNEKSKGANALWLMNGIKIERANIDTTSDEKFATIKGYACHFGVANENLEIVTADSFDNFFEKLAKAGIMPGFNFMHSPDTIIGGWDKLTPDATGLFAEGRLLKESAFVRNEVLPLMEAGFCNYLSTEGFVPWDAVDWNESDDTYTAKQFNLIRIALVDVPADLRQSELAVNAVTLERRKNLKNEPKRKSFSSTLINY